MSSIPQKEVIGFDLKETLGGSSQETGNSERLFENAIEELKAYRSLKPEIEKLKGILSLGDSCSEDHVVLSAIAKLEKTGESDLGSRIKRLATYTNTESSSFAHTLDVAAMTLELQDKEASFYDQMKNRLLELQSYLNIDLEKYDPFDIVDCAIAYFKDCQNAPKNGVLDPLIFELAKELGRENQQPHEVLQSAIAALKDGDLNLKKTQLLNWLAKELGVTGDFEVVIKAAGIAATELKEANNFISQFMQKVLELSNKIKLEGPWDEIMDHAIAFIENPPAQQPSSVTQLLSETGIDPNAIAKSFLSLMTAPGEISQDTRKGYAGIIKLFNSSFLLNTKGNIEEYLDSLCRAIADNEKIRIALAEEALKLLK